MSSFLKSTFVYFISNMFSAAIPFLLLPILTRNLSTDEYGLIAIFISLTSGLIGLVGLCVIGAADRKYYDGGVSKKSLSEFNGTCLQIICFTTIFLLFICFFLKESILKVIPIPQEWLFIAIISTAATLVISLRLGQWQIRGKATSFGCLQVSSSLLNLLLSLAFVLILGLGAFGRVWAISLVSISMALLSIVFLYKEGLLTFFCLRKDYLKESLSYGIPLIPHVFGVFLLTSIDRFVISDELGLGEAGVYMVAVQISSAFTIVFSSINKAYVPWLYNQLKIDDKNQKIVIVKNTFKYYLILILVGTLAFLFGADVVAFIVGEKFKAAGAVIGYLCLGQIFGGMYLMVTNYIFYSKKTGWLSLVTISSGGINILLMLILIEYWGLVGVGIAFCIAKFYQFILTWYLASKVHSMPWFSFK